MNAIKKWVVSLLIGGWLVSCSSADKPNATVEQAFVKKFGNVSAINWTENADYSFAHFTQHGKPVVAVFGNDGQLIATEPARPIH
ncbi:hypothetical protein G8759_11740 [Spirosoma aureum]|uniref:Uncharacterized protein n=1 Tax=Spirosoma aureum TaxID=2692134 RepID=A0A6G9ALA6_9BACT|nr:hypothetical protein [Spirosoma aureum]QIP13251.1 hypothetical protein G8759_11740 [Spirosoma aureum]